MRPIPRRRSTPFAIRHSSCGAALGWRGSRRVGDGRDCRLRLGSPYVVGVDEVSYLQLRCRTEWLMLVDECVRNRDYQETRNGGQNQRTAHVARERERESETSAG